MSQAHDISERARILLVDDEVAIGKLFQKYMEAHAPHVVCAYLQDSTKVMPWLELYECDGLVLDINMPGLDGLSLIAMIRQKFPKLPIIIFTGYGYDEGKMQQALNSGANGYVSKALPPEEIYMAIMGVIKH